MPKPMYVWTGTAWVSVASEVESLATYATQSYADNLPGTKMIIPTSVSVGSGTGSVDAIGNITFSSASSISINGAFTSTYDNYKVLIDVTASSAGSDLSFKYRTAGSDLTNTYYGAFTGVNHVNTVVTWGINNGAGAKLTEFNTFTKRAGFVDLTLNGPYLTSTKNATWNSFGVHTSTGAALAGAGGVGYDTSGSASDGISFIKSSGTMNGTIRIYGYKD